MENRGGKSKILGILAAAILVIALIHLLSHFYIFGIGFEGLYKKSISGFSFIEPKVIETMKQTYPNSNKLSVLFLVAEWILLGVILFEGRKKRSKEHIGELTKALSEKKSSSRSKTDLDALYEILKDKKELSLGEISKVFGVGSEVVLEWSRMLEEHELAELEYSNFGGTTLKIK
ncbi:MAG: hypothetical protein MUF61_01190 [archaeon]|jgi:hypothetical protein|nr:hypothetical protein [archaeon]